MPLRNNRNSRDDKSAKSNRSYPTNRNTDKSAKKDWRTNKNNSSYSSSNRSAGKKDWNSDKGEASSFEKRRGQEKPYQERSSNKPAFGNQKGRRYETTDGSKERHSNYRARSTDRDGSAKHSATKYERFKPETKRPTREKEDGGLIRLNRYIANSGVCSRRKADELIQAGVVQVNGTVVTELGTKVDPQKDEIRYNGERLKREKMVYILLNKPKDYITTTDDPQERRTIMHLVEKASKERIYPVGRLDRNTTGLILLTNDGNLAEKLSHPRNNIMKIYHIELSKNLTQGDLNKIGFGLELEDGFIKPDEVSYIQGASKNEVGIQIHSGKNRIVRRIFESLGYEVIKLDRVIYANLTKKDLPRGRWRHLEEKEIIQLKHFIK